MKHYTKKLKLNVDDLSVRGLGSLALAGSDMGLSTLRTSLSFVLVLVAPQTPFPPLHRAALEV